MDARKAADGVEHCMMFHTRIRTYEKWTYLNSFPAVIAWSLILN